MDDPIKKLVNCLRNCRGKDDPRFPQLLEAFREVAGNLTREADTFSQKIEQTRKSATDFIQESNINSKLRIEVSRFQIELVRNSFHPLPVPGKAIFSKLTSGPWKYEVDCLVFCGDWRRLWELKEDKINIIDHLSELIPQKQQRNRMGPIGLITFQNGMHNNRKNFKEMGQSIVEQFPERPLCIGLHNPTWGGPPPTDMLRFRNELKIHSSAVSSLFHMMKTLGEALLEINPNCIWIHVAHSEGGFDRK